MIYLLMGGSKSGKSMLAQDLCQKLGGRLYYLATMRPTDDEDAARIARHLDERDGWGFETVEQYCDLPACFPRICPEGTVLLDSVTALLAQEMFCSDSADGDAQTRTLQSLLALCRHAGHTVLVADFIFSDGADYDPDTEAYRRSLAHICRALAAVCDGVAELTAGQTVWHKGGYPN